MIQRIYKKMAAEAALFTIELLFIWSLFLGCIIIFLYLSSEVREGAPLSVDSDAFAFASRVSTDSVTTFIEAITFLGSRYFLTTAGIALIFYFLFIKRHRWYSLKVPVVALGSISLNLVLKNFFERPRPALQHLVEASGLSFPSGHSMVAASFYGLLIFLVWKHVRPKGLRYSLVALLCVIITLIGFSRIYLHVHYFTDVLAGFAAGFLWVIIGIWSLQKLERFTRKEINPVVMEEPPQSS